MSSTPMDVDGPDPSSANGTPIPSSSSLNIQRTLGGGLPSTSAVVDVIASYRPTKVSNRNPRDVARQVYKGTQRKRSHA